MLLTLTGSNAFVLQLELKKLVAECVAISGDMALERLDGEEASYDRIREAIQGMPFLTNKKYVVLRNPGANKEFSESFEALVPTIPDTTDVIIVEPKLDKRLSYYKSLKKLTDFREYVPLDEGGLIRWAVEEAKRHGGQMNNVVARVLVDRTGPNQQLLASEVEKLAIYNSEISEASVRDLVEPTPQSTVFELIEAAFSGQASKAITLYDEQRRARVEPQAIMGMIAWQLHVLAVLKTASTRSLEEIAKLAGLHPFVVRKNVTLVRNLSLARLKGIIAQAYKLDIDLKSKPIDADEALQYFIMSLTYK